MAINQVNVPPKIAEREIHIILTPVKSLNYVHIFTANIVLPTNQHQTPHCYKPELVVCDLIYYSRFLVSELRHLRLHCP